MSSLRKMIDGVGSLIMNTPEKPSNEIKPHQEVVIRRNTGRSSKTSEVMVGKVLAMNGDNVTVSINRPGGVVERRTVHATQIGPVTQGFRTQSIQFNPAFRGRV